MIRTEHRLPTRQRLKNDPRYQLAHSRFMEKWWLGDHDAPWVADREKAIEAQHAAAAIAKAFQRQ